MSTAQQVESLTTARSWLSAVRRPPSAILLLFLLCLVVALDRLSIRLYTRDLGLAYGNINFRVELIVGVLVAAYCLVRYRREVWQLVGLTEWLLGGWLLANAVSSILFSPEPRLSLQLTGLIVGILTLYMGARILLRTPQAMQWAVIAWVTVGALVALFGLLSALLFIWTGWTPGISFNRTYHDGILTLTPMVYSTLWEANIFGSYCLTVGTLAFALTLAPAFRSSRLQTLLRSSAALAFCGVVLSLTRTVWFIAVGLFLLICLVCLLRRIASWRQLAANLLLPALVGTVVGVTITLFMPLISWPTDNPSALNYYQAAQVASDAVRNGGKVVLPPTGPPPSPQATPVPTDSDSALEGRVQELGSLDTVPTLDIRREVLVHAWDGILRRPILGWGTGAYTFVYPYPISQSYWIPNLELHVLFDTGLVGLLLLGLAVGWTVWKGILALKLPPVQWETTHFALFGLLLAGLSLFLAYQLTDGSWLGFTWLLMAMLVSAVRLARHPAV